MNPETKPLRFAKAPFDPRAQAEFFYPGQQNQENLRNLKRAVHDDALVIVEGSAGSGKTTLVRAFLSELDSSTRAVVITIPAGGHGSLTSAIAKGLGHSIADDAGEAAVLGDLDRELSRAAATQRVIIVVERAENLAAADRATLAQLLDLFERGKLKAATILVGRTGFSRLLAAGESFNVRTTPAVIPVQGLLAGETSDYVRHRLGCAGAADSVSFDREALEWIERYGQGSPRTVNQLCSDALALAGARGTSTITRELMITATQRDGATISQDLIGPAELSHRTGNPSRDDNVEPANISGRRQQSVVRSLETLLNRGEDLADRLETLLRRNERAMERRHEALGEFENAEQSLTRAARNASQTAASLDEHAGRAGNVLEDLAGVEERIAGFDSYLNKVCAADEQVAANEQRIADRIAALNEAQSQAERVETRLSEFGRELSETAQKTQEKIEVLVSSVEVASQAQEQIEESLTRVHGIVDECRTTVADTRTEVNEIVDGTRVQIGELTESVHQLAELLSKQQGRQTKLDQSVDATAGRIDKAATVVAGIAKSADDVCDRVHQSVARAEFVDQRHEGMLAKLNASHDRCGQTLTKLLEVCGQSESVHRTAREILLEIGGAVERVQGLRSHVQEFERVADSIEHRTAEAAAIEAGVGRTTAEARTLLSTLETVLKDSTARTEDLDAKQQASVEILEALSAQVVTAIDQSSSLTELTTKMKGLEELSRNLAEGRETASGLIKRLGQSSDSGRRIVEMLAGASVEAEDKITRLDSHNAAASSCLHSLCDENKAAQATVKELQSVGELARTSLDDAVDRGRKVAEQLGEHLEQASAALANAGDIRSLLVESSHAAQNMRTVLDEARSQQIEQREEFDELRARAAFDESQFKEMIDGLTVIVGDAREAMQALTTCVDGARTEAVSAQTSAEQMHEICTHVEQRTNRAETVCKAIDQHVASADQAMTAIQSGSEVARTRVQELQAASEEAEGTQVKLSRVLDPAREVAAQLEQNLERADTRVQRLENALQLTTRAVSQLREISQAVKAAKATAENLSASVQRAQAQQDSLNSTNDKAGEKLDSLSLAASRIGELLAAGDNIAGGLKDIIQSLEASRTSALNVHGQIVDATTQGEELFRSLAKQQTSVGNTAKQAEALAGQIEQQKEALLAGDELLGEFANRCDTITSKIRELDHQAQVLSNKLTDAAEKPSKFLHEAQEQAEHLERICAAVRKVFASLSKTTLEANKQTDSLKQISTDATQRMEQLKSETEHAFGTLHEWIEEATRVQSRLERTLGKCPTIEQTHSTRQLFSGSRMTAPSRSASTRTAPTPAADQSAVGELHEFDELAALTARTREPTTASKGDELDAQRRRALEIAALINDAKAVSGQSKG